MQKDSEALKKAPHSLTKKSFRSIAGSSSTYFIGIDASSEVYHITRLEQADPRVPLLSIERVHL